MLGRLAALGPLGEGLLALMMLPLLGLVWVEGDLGLVSRGAATWMPNNDGLLGLFGSAGAPTAFPRSASSALRQEEGQSLARMRQ